MQQDRPGIGIDESRQPFAAFKAIDKVVRSISAVLHRPSVADMSKVDPPRRGTAVLKTRDFWVVASLFGLCTLLYYFGELIDFAGSTAVQRDFFYGVHDVHRVLFILPIVYAAHQFRIKGSLIVTVAAFLVFLPRAIMVSPFSDPILRPVLFTIVASGVFCIGILAVMWKARPKA